MTKGSRPRPESSLKVVMDKSAALYRNYKSISLSAQALVRIFFPAHSTTIMHSIY